MAGRTAIKLQRVFSYAPYDSATRAFVKAMHHTFRVDFEDRDSQVAALGLRRVFTAAQSATDLFGLDAYSVPMTSASARIQRYKDMLTHLWGANVDGSAGLVKQWDDQVVRNAANSGVDASRVKDLQNNAEAKRRTIDRLSKQITTLHEALGTVENEISIIDTKIKNREQELINQWEKEQEERKRRGETLRIAQAAAVVGSIAFPAAAPYLAGASGALALVDTFTDPELGFSQRVVKIADIAQRHTYLVQRAIQVRKEWNAVRDGIGDAIGYARKRRVLTDAEKKRFDDWKASVEALRKNMVELKEQLEPAGQPAKLEFPMEEVANDGEIITLVGQRNNAVQWQQSIISEISELAAQHDRALEEILELEAVIADLLTLKLENDEERLRYRQLSDWVKRHLLRDLAREAVLLRRSLVYATGEVIDLPVEILLTAEGDLAESYVDFAVEPNELEIHLAAERKRRAAVYNLLLSRALETYENLKTRERWNIPTPMSFSVDTGNLVGDPEFVALRRRFLDQLNTELAGTISGTRGRQLVRIPFEPTLTSATEGAVLLGINLARLEFEGDRPPDGKFTINIEHPRFGVLWRGGACTAVRDVPSGTATLPVRLTNESWPMVVPTDVSYDWQKKIDFANRLFRIQDVMFPFYTVYYLSVEVPEPREWRSPPKIKNIEIQFVAARPS